MKKIDGPIPNFIPGTMLQCFEAEQPFCDHKDELCSKDELKKYRSNLAPYDSGDILYYPCTAQTQMSFYMIKINCLLLLNMRA